MFDQIHSFPCPSCREIINDAAATCRYCGAPVDPAIALAAAETQSRVNQACSDASYLRTAAYVMWAFLAVSLVPFIPLVGWAFLVTFLAVIFLIVRWQVKFSDIITSDPDYRAARRSKNLALVLWLVALPTGFVVRPIVSLIFARLAGQL